MKYYYGYNHCGKRDKCTTFNRISNKHCMNYYWKHWKDVNEKLHDETFQSKRVTEWK